MFNVSKKTLSVVLCLALLASVVAVCFIPANAKTVVSQHYVYNNLSQTVAPTVNLTFEGEAKYGIPFGRGGGSVTYANGYAKANNSGGWIFIGNEASKSVATVKSEVKDDADRIKYVEENLYLFKKDKTYVVTIDYNFLAGSTISDRALQFQLATNPNQGPVAADNTMFTTKSVSGATVVWNVDGKAEIGATLTADSDMQTVTVSFTVKADGYLGIKNFVSDKAATLAIHDVKIYDCDAVDTDSTFQNKITFDNGLNGIGAVRYSTLASSYAKENGNRYGVINLKGTNVSAYLANTEYKSTERITAATDLTDTERLAEIDAIYKNLFKFEQDKKYEISFRYRYPADSTVAKGTELKFKVMADPLGQAHGADDLANWNVSGKQCWVKDVHTSGTVLEGNAGEWQQCKVIFTVKNSEEVAGYDNVRKKANGGYPFDGFYFGFLGSDITIHVDDYEVKEITGTVGDPMTTDLVYHDMEKDTINTSTNAKANGSILAEGNVGATIVDSGDAEHGNVLNLGSNAKRFAPADAGVITEGRKCYISFDARATAASTTKFTWFSIGLTQHTDVSIASQTNDRIVLHDSKQSGARKAFEFYVDGVETTYDNFIKLSTEWKHYGIIVDLTNADTLALFKTINSSWVNNTGKAVYIGAANSQYDNYTIISSSDVAGAVPETDGSDISYVSKTYENGMDSLDTITNYDKTTTSTVAVDGRGNVVKVTEGLRFCVNDTNFISKGHKYTISFDARLDVEDDTTEGIFMILSKTTNSGEKPRFFINNPNANSGAGGSSKDALVNAAFKFYEQNLTTKEMTEISSPRDLKINKTWKKYIIEFDYTNETFISTINAATSGDYYDKNNGKLTECDSYFHIGNINGMFDNLKIVEETPGVGTEVSIRKAQTFEDKYASAGLRFKAPMSTSVAKAASEIGFVVAPSSVAMSTENWYKLEDGVNSIARKGVVKDASCNIIYNYDKVVAGSEITEYQVVITGLSSQDGKTAYNRRYSAVLYTKDAEDNYSYYALGEASYYQGLGISEVLKAPKIKEAE